MTSYVPDRLLVLDIETVRDENLVCRDPERGFAKPPAHQVVAISFVEAKIERSGGSEAFLIDDCRSGGEDDYDEARLIAGFWRFFERKTPRLVTWNGRRHDMAVLRLRAMMLGVDVSCWSAKHRGRGYQFRYASDWHADLLDELSDYGSSVALSLDETAHAFGFPGKVVTGPGTVESLHREGKTAQIHAYCEADTLNLFGIYLRWAKATGLSSEKDCRRGLERLREYLQERRVARPHLGIFADRWREPAAPMVTATAAIGAKDRHDLAKIGAMRRSPALLPIRTAGSIATLGATSPPGWRRSVEPPPRMVRRPG